MTWAREIFRGTISSLVAPALLLAAALIVAIGGSGADALGSLGQLTKGPDIPPTPVEMVSRDAPVGADVGQLDGRLVASAGARAPQSSPSAGQGSPSAGQGARGSAPSAVDTTSGASPPSAAVSRPSESPGGSSGESGAAPGTTPSPTAPATPPSSSSPSTPAQPNPVGKVLEETKQLGNELLKPVKPITDQVLGGLPR